jgi:hypothetical protein
MTEFDRVAWCCSWVAPVSWVVLVLALLLSGLERRDSEFQTAVPGIALIAGSLGLAAHTLLAFHASRARVFSSAERKGIMRALWFGCGYRLWRDVMRSHRG